jgi:uncharacterized protein with FMN-binding domain
VSARRNACVLGATAVALSGLMLFPTSRGAGQIGPASPALPVGVVAAAPTGTTTVNGSSVVTRFGPVQVQITVKDGKITKVTAVDYPMNDRRDQEINSYAIPLLQDETVAAQSAQIDTVSGATYTSEGYVTSLQAALDAANL